MFYQAHNPESQRLATILQTQLARGTGITTRQALSKLDHCMLVKVNTPAVTVEAGFLSNPREAGLLMNGPAGAGSPASSGAPGPGR